MNLAASEARYDLHCHSTASDGMLPPAEVVARAHANGVTTLALTDHDGLAGLPEAQAAAEALGLNLVPGTEISVEWNDHSVHIVEIGRASCRERVSSPV